MALSATQLTLLCVIGLVLFARPTHAFGAGNIASISKIEGQNWRHGDLEDTLLSIVASKALNRKFGKLDVKRVYFGNWLRDYSQAVDVGTVKYVSAKAITILLWILGFMSFGYGTKEFEVTMERLGCYRPEEHIDNPKDYADNEDARNYDRRLRGPVDERRELSVDSATGMKSYIASENKGITTSAGLVRKLFSESIELGRRYNRNGNKADLYEALRLLGTGCHCLEDFSAHSNYTELALIEMGERNVFPHVGRNTQIRLDGARNSVYPLVTGTFGGVDFLHSVTGEFDDKVTQSEIQELENTMNQAQQNQGSTSMLQELLNKVPEGFFGDKNEAGKADELKQNAAAHQMQNTNISPREPEEWTRYLDDVQRQIYPIIEYHDEIMQSITETIEKIPILPDLLDSLTEQLNVFVFSLIAPFVLPIINQVKSELTTGSSAIIESSVQAQHIVFSDDRSTDPTHSMLSKDHFSNVLNEPAGKVASQVLKWVVPQLMAAWDDERIDIDRTLNRIIRGVLHHPAMRDYGDDGAVDGRRLMFGVVEQWWQGLSEREKNGLRDQISRDGVEQGRNHKPGVKDHGHGSAKPLGMPGLGTTTSSGAPGGTLGGFLGQSGGQSSAASQAGQMASDAVGGGVLGGLVSGLVSGVGGDILGGGFDNNQKQTYNRRDEDRYGNQTQTVTQMGSSGNTYGQAQYSRTDYSGGGRTEQYNRYEQSQTTSGGYRSEYHHEEQTSSGGFRSETRRYGDDSSRRQETSYGSGGYGGRIDNDSYGGRQQGSRKSKEDSDDDKPKYGRKKKDYDDDDDDDDNRKKYGRKQKDEDSDDDRQNYGRKKKDNDSDEERQQYGRKKKDNDSDDDRKQYGRKKKDDDSDDDKQRRYGSSDNDNYGSGGYGRENVSGYGNQGRYGAQETTYDRRNEGSNYGSGGGGYGQQESYGGSYGGGGGYGGRQEGGYGSQQEGGYGESRGYGGDRGYGRGDDDEDESGGGGYGRQQQYGGGQGGGYGGNYGGNYGSNY